MRKVLPLLSLCLFPALLSAMSVTASSSLTATFPLGSLTTWTASVSDANPGTIWYRFSAHAFGADLQIIQDFGPSNTLDWTVNTHEGLYFFQVDAENVSTGETATTVTNVQIQSLVSGSQPVISPTAHSMVWLYSAPGCPAGGRMRVAFTDPNNSTNYTPYQNCTPNKSMNFYLAGMRAATKYSVQHMLDSGTAFQPGPKLSLTTNALPPNLVDATPVTPAPAKAPDGILFQANLFTQSITTDLAGNIIWYFPGTVSYITRMAPGGYFFAVLEDATGDQSQQTVSEFDLTGMTVRTTNAARVNQQLQALGARPISGFHHEARLLADGTIAVLAGVEQVLTDVQGPGQVDVLGDMIIVFDRNFQVLWTWDTFDHLDVSRLATLGDVCQPGDCPATFLNAPGTYANDWTHGNSLQQTPDGNFLYSTRSQDWVIKIDYENGLGSGNILWRLGNQGDFQIVSTDPSPWFSHQHDPQYLADDTTILVFDNGNVRNAADPSANSRGQVLQVNEDTKVATLAFNQDLGMYSFALGAAQMLPDGNYHFLVGYLLDATSYTYEVAPAGQFVYELHTTAPAYRTFRMPDLYTPPYGTH